MKFLAEKLVGTDLPLIVVIGYTCGYQIWAVMVKKFLTVSCDLMTTNLPTLNIFSSINVFFLEQWRLRGTTFRSRHSS